MEEFTESTISFVKIKSNWGRVLISASVLETDIYLPICYDEPSIESSRLQHCNQNKNHHDYTPEKSDAVSMVEVPRRSQAKVNRERELSSCILSQPPRGNAFAGTSVMNKGL